jgi:hypothetical protein
VPVAAQSGKDHSKSKGKPVNMHLCDHSIAAVNFAHGAFNTHMLIPVENAMSKKQNKKWNSTVSPA